MVERQSVCLATRAAAGKSVDDQIAKVKPATDDTVMPNSADKPGLTFTNIHYFAAAVSRYGTKVKGGYEYSGKQYDALFDHVSTMDTARTAMISIRSSAS